MTEADNDLIVIEDVYVRILIRKEAKQLILEKNICPPAEFELLHELASELIIRTGIDKKYLNFAIVVCGNEIWRNVVAATPFNRRLLLLPQCLRNSNGCKGDIDSLGLICKRCGKCKISDILEKAEDMGYATLVAEGTTIAVGLVEEGAIDAVIGVSCMQVLQRSFNSVSNSALPALGLPLLKNGCEDTELDYDWVMEEINLYQENKNIEPLSVSVIKEHINSYFSDYNLNDFFEQSNETELVAKEMLTIGGQRIRPLFAVLAYRSYMINYNEDLQKQIAIIIECFHKASLIHDDIEDNDDFRYGHKTLHKTHGIPFSINVGDFLIGKGYRLLSELNVHPELLAESLKVVASSHINLTIGQGVDLNLKNRKNTLQVNELIDIYSKKTGEAMNVALLLGAIAGNADSEDIVHLKLFSESFGVAYQVRDDLNEFRCKTEKTDNFPFIIALLNEKKGYKDFSYYEMNSDDLFKIIKNEGVDILAESYIKYFTGKCYCELDQLKNLKMKLSLYGIMGKIF